MNREIKVKNLKIAAIRYYNGKNIDPVDPLGYVILEKIGEKIYINPFDKLKEYPVFEGVTYSKVTKNSWEYCTKLRLVNFNLGDVSGPCYVLFNTDLSYSFDKDVVSESDLEEYILRSKYYFKDRKEIAKKRIKEYPFKMLKILFKDSIKEEKMLEFFTERGVQLQKS